MLISNRTIRTNMQLMSAAFRTMTVGFCRSTVNFMYISESWTAEEDKCMGCDLACLYDTHYITLNIIPSIVQWELESSNLSDVKHPWKESLRAMN